MRNLKAISSAAVATLTMTGLAHAQYTSVSTFDGVYPAADASEAWDFRADAINAPTVYDHWSGDVLPTAGSLVLFPVNNSTGQQTLTLGTARTVYGVNLTTPGGTGGTKGVTLTGGTLVLLSQDSTTDSVNSLARAIDVGVSGVTTGGDRLRITSGIVLGDGNQGAGIHYAYVNNTIADAALGIENKIAQFSGSSWGLVFQGNRRIELKSSNYLSHQYELTGGVRVDSGAHIRVYNNVIPSGAGNTDLTLNGQFRISQNSGQIVINGLQGTDSTAILTTQTSNRDLVIGANDANSSYAGTITGGINIYKVGGGDLPFTNAANNFTGNLVVSKGTVTFGSIANSGSASALGNGNSTTSGITFDGGALRYDGAGSTSNRTFTVGLRGGTVEANGTGALVLGSASWGTVATDTAFSAGRHNAANSSTVGGMVSLDGLSSLLPNLTVSSANVTGLSGAQAITSLDASTGTMVLTSGVVGAPGSGVGAAQFTFASSVAVDRALTLSGTSTADNKIAASMSNSPLSKLGVIKTGAGKWIIDNPQYMTGDVVVNQGTLVVDGDNAAAANITGTTASGNSTITAVSSTAGLVVGQPVTGAGIPAGASIRSIDTVNSTITLSTNATLPATGVALSLPAGTGGGLGNVTVNNTGTYINNKSQFVGGSAQAAGTASAFTVNSGGAATVTDTLKVWNTGSVAVNGNLTAGKILSAGSLAINNGGKVTVPAAANTSKAASLSVTGSGTLDLNNNNLIIQSGTVASIESLVASAASGRTWTGTGITSTSAKNNNTYSLGVASGSAFIATNGNILGGETISGSDVVVRYTYSGDADLNGVVDVTDLGLLATAWQTNGNWAAGDFDYSGFIDVTDLGILATNWQLGVGGPPLNLQVALSQFSAFDGVSVPEPASLGLLVLAGMGMARRRRQSA